MLYTALNPYHNSKQYACNADDITDLQPAGVGPECTHPCHEGQLLQVMENGEDSISKEDDYAEETMLTQHRGTPDLLILLILPPPIFPHSYPSHHHTSPIPTPPTTLSFTIPTLLPSPFSISLPTLHSSHQYTLLNCTRSCPLTVRGSVTHNQVCLLSLKVSGDLRGSALLHTHTHTHTHTIVVQSRTYVGMHNTCRNRESIHSTSVKARLN